MLRMSESIKNIASALCKAQAKITGAQKCSNNPFFKSKYADLADVWDACKEALTENGLSVSQHPQGDGDKLVLTTILMHTSGEWMESSLTMKPVKSDPQGMGSCITYARRYALAGVCGIAQVDDDGNAASRATPAAKVKPKREVKPITTSQFSSLCKKLNGYDELLDRLKLKYALADLQDLPHSAYSEVTEKVDNYISGRTKKEAKKTIREQAHATN